MTTRPDDFAKPWARAPRDASAGSRPWTPRDPSAKPWAETLRDAAVSGSVASVLSTAIVAAAGHREVDRPLAPTNATSQWIWGRAPDVEAATLKHTVPGYLIHHAMSVLWATLYERATGGDRPGSPPALPPAALVGAGLATAAAACFADYGVVPRRLSPGFETQISPKAIALSYVGFGLGLALASMLRQRRGRASRSAAASRSAGAPRSAGVFRATGTSRSAGAPRSAGASRR